jgi:hypothetical protein
MNIPYSVILFSGLICLALGVVLSSGAARFPEHEAVLEQWGGNIFVGGLVLVGLGFPLI